MRGRILRSLLLIPMVLVLMVLGPGPAFASPLDQATASAYGIKVDLLGSPLVPPTPTQSAGPDPDSGSSNLLPVDLSTVAFSGTAGAKARTTLQSIIENELPDANLNVTQGGPALPANFNAQGYARTEGVAVLADALPGLDAVTALAGISDVLSGDTIHSEALVSCVAGQTVIAGGSQMAAVIVLGIDLTDLLDGTVNQTIPVAGTVLEALGGSIIANEQIPTANGLQVNALHVTLPGILEIIVAHTEVSGAACDPNVTECNDGIDNDGDGAIDFGEDPECDSPEDDSEAPECSNDKDDDGDGAVDEADPGCHTDGDANNPNSYDPNDDDEGDLLPRTGGNDVALGIAILGAGGIMLLAGRKVRRVTQS